MGFKSWAVAVVPVWLCASAVWAQDAAKAPAKPPEGAAFKSFDAIQSHFNELQEQSQKAIEKQRLGALEGFLPKAPEDEREVVLATMVEVTASLDMYDRAAELAEQFLKNHAASKNAGAIRKMRLVALAQGNHLPQARKEWEAFLKEVAKPEQVGDIIDSAMQLADACADSGDVKAAREVYETLRKGKLQDVIPENQRAMFAQQLEQAIAPRLANLEQIGQAPPAIMGKTMTGETVDLAKYKGRVVLLDFWATWCGPCVAALPDLKEVYRKHHDKGFEVIGISLDMDEQALKDFVKNRGMAWPQVWDNQGQPDAQNPFGGPNSRNYNLTAIPTTWLLDKDGRVARVMVAARPLDDVVSRLLARPAGQAAPAEAKPEKKAEAKPEKKS